MASETVQNFSNIPSAPFSEDVSTYVKQGEKPDIDLNGFQSLLSKYRMMEKGLQNKKARFSSLLSELENSLSAVKQMFIPGDLTFDFELGDTLYAKAIIPENEGRKVGLWLGAGIMLEYELEEASIFLEMKISERKDEIRKVDHDLDFLRNQITTMEVNIARLYNWILNKSKSK